VEKMMIVNTKAIMDKDQKTSVVMHFPLRLAAPPGAAKKLLRLLVGIK